MNHLITVLQLLAVTALLSTGITAAENPAPSNVTFTGTDGVKLAGLFRAPQDPLKTTFILLHGLGSDKNEWRGLANLLIEKGYGVLAYDARGHGESTMSEQGTPVSYRSFDAAQWKKIIPDLGQAVQFLSEKKKIPSRNIGFIGASLGANVSLVYAASNSQINPVILLSPGLNYAGIGTADAITAFETRPLAIVVSPGDTYAYQSAALLYQRIRANKRALYISGRGGHGVQMFDGDLENKILRWINEVATGKSVR